MTNLEIDKIKFIEGIQLAIAVGYESAQKNKVPVTFQGKGGAVDVSILFKHITFHSNISSLLEGHVFFSDFLKRNSSLKKSKTKIDDIISLVKLDNSLLSIYMLDERDVTIDYLKEIYHSLILIEQLISKSRRVIKKRAAINSDYCAFCWRLVNKNQMLNFDDSADFSKSYCFEHHPNKNSTKYHKARNSLFSSIKNYKPDLQKEFESKKKDGSLSSNFYFKATSAFSPKSGIPTNGENTSIQDAISWVFIKSEKIYPNSFEAIRSLRNNNFKTWLNFFITVIGILDNTGIDRESWNDTGIDWESDILVVNDALQIFIYDTPEIGIPCLMAILKRYNCFKLIEGFYLRRGPEKGTVQKNTVLRNSIEKLIKLKLEKGDKINVTEISKSLGVSRQRIYVIRKELGL